jgi:hypothetical protein
VDFADVLNDELDSITVRRLRVRGMVLPLPEAAPAAKAESVAPRPTDDPGAAAREAADPTPREKKARLTAMDRHLAGLALSGGGIRSATFALGVIQGLAALRILSRFDYLSTVSGGGYIGGWLAAWIKREGNPLSVENQLAQSRITEAKPDREFIRKQIVDEEPEPIHHLRSYSNYLTPRPGLLSLDTWTVLTIYVRNAIINQLLLLPLAMIFVLLGRCIVGFYASTDHIPGLRVGVLACLVGLLSLAFLSLLWHVSHILGANPHDPKASQQSKSHDGSPHADPTRESQRPKRRDGVPVFLALTIIGPMVVAAVLACWSFSSASSPPTAGGAEPPPVATRLPSQLEYYLVDPKLVHANQSDIYSSSDNPQVEVDRGGLDTALAIKFGFAFGGLALGVHVLGYLGFRFFRRDPDTIAQRAGEVRNRFSSVLWMSSAAFMAGSTGGFLFYAMVSRVLWRLEGQPEAIATIGPPLALMVVVAATFVEVWLLGRWEGDDLREWWARICAWLVIVAVAWLAFFGISLYAPMAANQLLRSPHMQVGAVMGWLATAVGGAVAGQKPESQGAGAPWWLKLLIGVAPTVFVAGLLVIVAMLVNGLVSDPIDELLVGFAAAPVLDGSSPSLYWFRFLMTPIGWTVLVMVGCAVLVGLAAVMSNVNLFSLNSMYASRLTRCYLGASRPKIEWKRRGEKGEWRPGSGGAPTATDGPARWQNPLTGFDPEDDIELWRLKIGPEPIPAGSNPPPKTQYLGPHLIMNTSLNLVAGSELAWQDRKAESFILTPESSGSMGTGYAPTTPKTGRELTLGRAMSISGAAVDSNIGLHQSSALIALMTAFNARLGWWIKNPNPLTWTARWLRRGQAPLESEWDAASPSLAWPLLMELLGQTNATRKWIHVSDGGHFENLGVYELVRRRCRYIVCTDAGTDPSAADDNLANMIRLCLIDFGVRIEIDTSPLAREGPDKLSRWHCAVGKIRYDDVDGGERPGIFVYLRTSMTGDEPPDVQEYASKNSDFPWQSTLDQFFNESQFESYRALGFHVARTAFKDALDTVTNSEPLWSNHNAEIEFKRGNQRLFSAVQRRWSSAPSDQSGAATRASRSWTTLQETLGSEKDLVPLNLELYPELKSTASTGPDVSGLHAVFAMIQVMEDAWADLRMGEFTDLPTNRGWMVAFRRWTSTPTLRRLWPILRGEYSQDFVKFCETQLGLGVRLAAVGRAQLDQTFFESAKKLIGEEFAREWPAEPALDDLIHDAEQNWSGWTDQQPISLLIQAPLGNDEVAESPDKVACGIVFASRLSTGDPVRDQPARFEIFVWMRRAYRGLGIASHCALKILTHFRQTLRDDHKVRPFTIQARYPAKPTEQADDRKDEIEYHLWLNFFSHYDFRCPRGKEAIRNGYWVIERTFRPEEIEL